ncbi:hypothetical protein K4F52_010348 [Lecanicillium sp. MT-2017a]|nr:hypothetical protein K4F52_010348 [Lecanicillium sp. MT-2017a]
MDDATGKRDTRFDFYGMGDDPVPEAKPTTVGGPLKHSPYKRRRGEKDSSTAALAAISEEADGKSIPGYELICNVWLGSTQYVVAQSHVDHEPVLVQSLSKAEVRNILKTSHNNVLKVVNTFFQTIGSRELHFVGWEIMQFSLLEVKAHHLLTDARLASVLGQVANGLDYLQELGLEHEELSCASALVNDAGEVKISRLENCQYKKSANNSAGFKKLAMDLVGFSRSGTSGNYALPSLPLTPSAVAFVEFIDKAPSSTSPKDVLMAE